MLAYVLMAATLVGQGVAQGGRLKAGQRPERSHLPPLPGSLNMTRARRILVAGLPLSGASLFAATLLQVVVVVATASSYAFLFVSVIEISHQNQGEGPCLKDGVSSVPSALSQVHHSVGVTDVDPNLPCPKVDDFKDVHKGFFIVLRVTPNERHTLSDYVESAFVNTPRRTLQVPPPSPPPSRDRPFSNPDVPFASRFQARREVHGGASARAAASRAWGPNAQ